MISEMSLAPDQVVDWPQKGQDDLKAHSRPSPNCSKFGVMFGYVAARRAARLDLIEGLRHE
jgi:hypothetical protein